MPAIRRDSFYAARFWERVDKSGDCWLWTRCRNSDGYGVTHVRVKGQLIRSAHRAAYVLEHGAIPEGLHIDHLCRTRACVRPDHLEAVTPAENNRRIPREFVGRPRKADDEKYRTPVRTFRAPQDTWDAAKATARANQETVTDVLIRALEGYAKGEEAMTGKTYTLAEARLELARQECSNYGHDWDIEATVGTGPVGITCIRCGWSGDVKMRAGEVAGDE